MSLDCSRYLRRINIQIKCTSPLKFPVCFIVSASLGDSFKTFVRSGKFEVCNGSAWSHVLFVVGLNSLGRECRTNNIAAPSWLCNSPLSSSFSWIVLQTSWGFWNRGKEMIKLQTALEAGSLSHVFLRASSKSPVMVLVMASEEVLCRNRTSDSRSTFKPNNRPK